MTQIKIDGVDVTEWFTAPLVMDAPYYLAGDWCICSESFRNCDCTCSYCKRLAVTCLCNPCPDGLLHWCSTLPDYRAQLYGER